MNGYLVTLSRRCPTFSVPNNHGLICWCGVDYDGLASINLSSLSSKYICFCRVGKVDSTGACKRVSGGIWWLQAIAEYPQQCIWHMMAVVKSSNPLRAKRCAQLVSSCALFKVRRCFYFDLSNTFPLVGVGAHRSTLARVQPSSRIKVNRYPQRSHPFHQTSTAGWNCCGGTNVKCSDRGTSHQSQSYDSNEF